MMPHPDAFKEIFEQVFSPVNRARRIGTRILAVCACIFVFSLFYAYSPEPHAGAKANLTSQGRWQEVPVSNYGPFLTPTPGPDGWNRWLLSETLEEFLLLGREVNYLSQGQMNKEHLDCLLPEILGLWERKGLRRYLLGCEPRDAADPRAYLLIFRAQEESWALEHISTGRIDLRKD